MRKKDKKMWKNIGIVLGIIALLFAVYFIGTNTGQQSVIGAINDLEDDGSITIDTTESTDCMEACSKTGLDSDDCSKLCRGR